jgi:leader peptidase (prepilin peptidase)/N-methyltransferase
LNALVAPLLTGAIVYGSWRAAEAAAIGRGLQLDAPPPVAVALAPLAAALAAVRGEWSVATDAVVAVVTVAAIVDARTGFIFDSLTGLLVLICLTVAAASGHMRASLVGAAVIGASLFVLYVLTLRRGIGLGDVKLAAGIGAGLGVLDGSIAIAASFVAGGIAGIWLVATGRARRDTALRFGPFLAVGTYTSVLVAAWR